MSWAGVIVPGGAILVVGIMLLLAYRCGRKTERAKAAERAAEVKDEQLKVDCPSRGDVARRLRDGSF